MVDVFAGVHVHVWCRGLSGEKISQELCLVARVGWLGVGFGVARQGESDVGEVAGKSFANEVGVWIVQGLDGCMDREEVLWCAIGGAFWRGCVGDEGEVGGGRSCG